MGISQGITPIILCADDYGVTTEVGEGIRQLVARHRLSAVSCLSSAPMWAAEANLLKPLRKNIDVGLHFNLTLGFAAQPRQKLAAWLIKSLTTTIDYALVDRELHRQLDLFESGWGAPPDFVDGHQHIHIFPGIRHSFLRILAQRYPQSHRPWLRRVNPSLGGHDAAVKALILKLLTTGFAAEARRSGFHLSNGFFGLYSLRAAADYAALMAGWLHRCQPYDLIMCHPAAAADNDPDGIGAARLHEYNYLGSDQFSSLCCKEKIGLSRCYR